MLDLSAFLERKPPALSGGECQRVALGRALVRQPRVLGWLLTAAYLVFLYEGVLKQAD
jgi:ABC-type molybdate transport system ATPase subunit